MELPRENCARAFQLMEEFIKNFDRVAPYDGNKKREIVEKFGRDLALLVKKEKD